MPNKDIDRREEILHEGTADYGSVLYAVEKYKEGHFSLDDIEASAKSAMDSYFTERAYELLEYMAKNKVQCGIEKSGDRIFWYAGQWLSKEQLFENFL